MEVEPNPAMNYVVLAHKPTAVVKAIAGNFTGPDLNLIVAKSTRIELYKSTETGLEAMLDVPVYGRISSMELIKPKAHKQQLLFVLVERYQFFLLQYNTTTKELDTVANGDVRDTVGRPCDNGHILTVDPQYRCVGMQLYDGMFKVIAMDDSGPVGEAFNTRLEELNVIDIVMVAGCVRPTIAVLYEDTAAGRHLKSYEISISDKDLFEVDGYIAKNLDRGSSLIVPLPLGGVLVIGEQAIQYVGKARGDTCTVPMRATVIKTWGRIDADGSRFLLSDHMGLLYVLVVMMDNKAVIGLKLELVGRTSCASSLCYLDSGVVFVGSRQGDSQLIRLHAQPPDPAAPQSFVQVLDTWPNLGPIVDFAVTDLDRQGQGQLVCCSGALTDGSLRVVRNGVGLNTQAAIELPGIRGLWSLHAKWGDPYHQYLVLTFTGETRVLAINQDDELDEAELAGFDAAALTLWCGNSASGHLVQVTPAGVRAVSCEGGMLEAEWTCAGGHISVASGNPTQVVAASGGGKLHLLEVGTAGVTHVLSHDVGAEVACVDVTPIGDDPYKSRLVVVGTWDMEVHVYAVEGEGPAASLQLLTKQQLDGEVIPRSVLMWRFEDVPHLLVGLGDGHLHHWRMSAADGSLTDKKKLVLGSKAVLLRPFKGSAAAAAATGGAAQGTPNQPGAAAAASGVFAATDRPAVLYSSNKKVLFANLNETEVTGMAPFNSASFPDSLALAKEGALMIGTIDELQKLHIRSLPLHEQPRRIAMQEETNALGVITIMNLGMEDESSFVRVFDAGGTMEQRASYMLGPGETGCCIVSCKLGDSDTTPYFVVGTGIARPNDVDVTKGRLLVLKYSQGQLSLVTEREVNGAVHDVKPFVEGRLLSSCNNRIHVHKWIQKDDSSRELEKECQAHGHVHALYLDARGNHVLVGDLMRSLCLYIFKENPPALEQRAQDYASIWCTAVTMLDDDTYLAAENSYNMIVSRKCSDTAADEDAGRLEVVGEYHLGEFVNRIRPGCLAVRLPDSQLAQVPTWLFGTLDGAVGVLASLPPPLFDMLRQLQDAMTRVIQGVGGLKHAEWRSFANEHRVADPSNSPKGFIDGDLIETFLDLKPEDAKKVVGLMGGGVTVEEVVQKVEELARLH